MNSFGVFHSKYEREKEFTLEKKKISFHIALKVMDKRAKGQARLGLLLTFA